MENDYGEKELVTGLGEMKIDGVHAGKAAKEGST